MSSWITVFILGVVEGLTEFIPVSSTGHLLIVEQWIHDSQSDLFNVVIQCGAVLAVIPLFHERIRKMLSWRDASSRDLALKVIVAFIITGIGGLILEKKGFKLPESVVPVAIALIAGGIIFIIVEFVRKGGHLRDSITWPVTIAVAVGQLVAAAFPGASRSGATIIFAMILGANRVVATEFSFLVGIPTMLAAGTLKIYKGLKNHDHENWGLLLFATVVAAIVSFIAVKWLLRFVQTHTFIGFGIYRILLGILLLWIAWPKS
ncbi:MAG: undecaprenyl-diphosphate phosphatase [Chthoniobacterales bacterium]